AVGRTGTAVDARRGAGLGGRTGRGHGPGPGLGPGAGLGGGRLYICQGLRFAAPDRIAEHGDGGVGHDDAGERDEDGDFEGGGWGVVARPPSSAASGAWQTTVDSEGLTWFPTAPERSSRPNASPTSASSHCSADSTPQSAPAPQTPTPQPTSPALSS